MVLIKECLRNKKGAADKSVSPLGQEIKTPKCVALIEVKDPHAGHLGRVGEAPWSQGLVRVTSDTFWHKTNQGRATTATEVRRCFSLPPSSHCILVVGLCCWLHFKYRDVALF